MKKMMTISALVLLTFVSAGNIFAEKKPAISEYAFEKNILIKNAGEEVKIPLDKEVLKNTKRDFSNFAIFDGLNQNVDFEVYVEDFKSLKDVEVLEVSSMREQEGREAQKSDIADDNHFTVFNFSERVDRANASWALFDLGQAYPLGRIEIFVPSRAKIKYVEIKAGNSVDDLKTIVAKKLVKPVYNKISLSTPNYRFVKVSFWGVNVRVEDIKFTTSTNGFIYFTPKVGEKYFARYGNDALNFFEFKERLETEKNVSETAYMTNQKWNKKVRKDLDDDGVANEEDNCPFVANRFQKDSDDDRIGNACDNAPDAMNFDQADTDGDGVGDIVDNCELYPNPDQANKDGDEYGDVCDGADSDGSSILEGVNLPVGKNFAGNKYFLGGLILLALGALGMYLKKKKK
jgi:hypothetical protein